MGFFKNIEKFVMFGLVAPLLAVNLILTSILFYMLIPIISPTYNIEYAQRTVQQIMPLVKADAMVVWGVNLETNSRKPLSYAVSDPKDHAVFMKYVETAQEMKFTAAVNPQIFQSLLVGDGVCYNIGNTGIVSSTIVGDFIRDNPNAMSCSVPIANPSTGILNSYVLMVWKQPLDAERQRAVLQQVKVTINQR